MKKILYIIVCLFLSTACSTDKSRKEQVANVSPKEQLKNEKTEPTHEDTITAKPYPTEVVKQQAAEEVPVINNKQINITYKGKDRSRIVKVTDIFKNIYYVPLETNEVVLLNPEPNCIIF